MRLIVLSLTLILTLLGQKASLPDTWQALMDNGNLLSRAGHFQDALGVFRQAIKAAALPDSPPERLAFALNGQAMSYDQLAQPHQAQPVYRRALAIFEKALGHESSEYAVVLANLGGSYIIGGQYSKAESFLRESIGIHTRIAKPDPISLALARNCLAKLLMNRGSLDEAAATLDSSISVFAQYPAARAQLGMAINNRAALLSHQGQYDKAAASFEQALQMLEESLGTTNPLLAETLVNLGTVYRLAGRYEEARSRLDRAKAIAEAGFGMDHPVYGSVLESYAELFKKTGHKAEARKAQAQARSILDGNARQNGLGMTVDVSSLR